VRLALTDLDDVRVSKEMAVISGVHNLAKLSGPALPPRPPSMDETRQALEQGTSREQVARVDLEEHARVPDVELTSLHDNLPALDLSDLDEVSTGNVVDRRERRERAGARK